MSNTALATEVCWAKATSAASSSRFPTEFPPAGERHAVVHGFGAIGRGFLAEIFRRSGYRIIGVDTAKPRNDIINQRGSYPIIIEDDRRSYVERVDAVTVVDAQDRVAVGRAYAETELTALALVQEALPRAVADLAAAVVARVRERRRPLTVIVALNCRHAAAYVRELLRAELAATVPDEIDGALAGVHLVDTVVNRMARNAGAGDPDATAVYTEPVYTLPAHAASPILRTLAQVEAITDLRPHAEMKLFLSNCAHAAIAYRGHLAGYRYIGEAIVDRDIRGVIDRILHEESGPALVARWRLPAETVAAYCDSVLERFASCGRRDEIQRVARNPIRKLGRDDRLVGPALMALEHGIEPRGLAVVIAAALRYDVTTERDMEPAALQERLRRGVRFALREVSGLDRPTDERLIHLVERAFGR